MQVWRCFGDAEPVYAAYHDLEWGRPLVDERGLYEKLCLEAFQAGLSWAIVLRKRPALREAFAGFDPECVAAFTQADTHRLLADARLIRNRRKIEAAITNARAVLALREQGASLVDVVWSHRPDPRPAPRTFADVPATTPQSVALATDLRRRAFAFVGPTTMYALMQAGGLVNDHLADCWVRAEVDAAQARHEDVRRRSS